MYQYLFVKRFGSAAHILDEAARLSFSLRDLEMDRIYQVETEEYDDTWEEVVYSKKYVELTYEDFVNLAEDDYSWIETGSMSVGSDIIANQAVITGEDPLTGLVDVLILNFSVKDTEDGGYAEFLMASRSDSELMAVRFIENGWVLREVIELP